MLGGRPVVTIEPLKTERQWFAELFGAEDGPNGDEDTGGGGGAAYC